MSDTLRAQLEQIERNRCGDIAVSSARLTLDAVEAGMRQATGHRHEPWIAVLNRLRLSLSVRTTTTEEEQNDQGSSGGPSLPLVGHGGVVKHSSSSDLAHVIFGEEGDYERSEWPVRVYFDQNAAETEAARMNGLVLAYEEASAGDPYQDDDAAFDAWDTRRRLRLQAAASKLRDPQFDVYVADKYRVVSVPIASATNVQPIADRNAHRRKESQ